jgi:hypothetical protein
VVGHKIQPQNSVGCSAEALLPAKYLFGERLHGNRNHLIEGWMVSGRLVQVVQQFAEFAADFSDGDERAFGVRGASSFA